jgi:hypothetical protein
MLEIGRAETRTCQGVTRRSLLQVGGIGALGLTLPGLLAAQPAAARPATARSVILLWLFGAPSHLDLWDLKPDAPSEVRGPFRPIRTSAPGMEISELLPQVARQAHRFSLVRSMHHDDSDHNVGGTVSLTGVPFGGKVGGGAPLPGPRRPTLGSLVARLRGFHPGQLPPFVCAGQPARVSFGASGQDAAGLGALYEAFRVEYNLDDGLKLPPEFTPSAGITTRRLDDRRRLLAQLDRFEASLDRMPELEKAGQFHRQAFSLLTSPAARKAFNLDEEPAALRNRYGRTRFGQSCLLARRLAEAAVPFIQVNWSDHGEDQQTSGGDGGWDHHWRLFEFIQDGGYAWGLDQALSALVADLQDRGMLDSTLIIATGEFGRTPKINGCGGRDHWPGVYTSLFAGGGVQGGRVVGESDTQGAYPASNAVHPFNVHATVIQALGLDRLALIPLGAGFEAEPIHELF